MGDQWELPEDQDPVLLTEDVTDDTPTLVRQQDTPIDVGIPTGSAEPYQGRDDQGQLVDQTEKLVFTWFVESGTTNLTRTSPPRISMRLRDGLRTPGKPT